MLTGGVETLNRLSGFIVPENWGGDGMGGGGYFKERGLEGIVFLADGPS